MKPHDQILKVENSLLMSRRPLRAEHFSENVEIEM